jgi:hypothetical protein
MWKTLSCYHMTGASADMEKQQETTPKSCVGGNPGCRVHVCGGWEQSTGEVFLP